MAPRKGWKVRDVDSPLNAYVWRDQDYSVPAEVVGSIVATIAATEGSCPPQRLVQEAEPETSPLHPLFTWNDSEAADSWRTAQARRIIRSLRVTVVFDNSHKTTTAPAFISVGRTKATKPRGSGYRPTADVLSDKDFQREALRDALASLKTLRVRYAMLKELAGVWEAVDSVEID